MAGSQATRESYGGPDAVEFTTARGAVVRGRCLRFGVAMRLMQLMDRRADGDQTVTQEILTTFTEDADLGDARVTAAEMLLEVLPHFLFLGGTRAAPAQTPPPEEEKSSTTAGTI